MDNKQLENVQVRYTLNGADYNLDSGSTGFVSKNLSETVPVGTEITYACTLPGFMEVVGSFVVTSNTSIVHITQSVTPQLSSNQKYRVVLGWGAEPEDLDLFVTETDPDGSSCDTFWAKLDATGDEKCTITSLDVDNRDGGNYGVETITWSDEPNKSSFLVYVHDFSGDDEEEINPLPMTSSMVGIAIRHKYV